MTQNHQSHPQFFWRRSFFSFSRGFAFVLRERDGIGQTSGGGFDIRESQCKHGFAFGKGSVGSVEKYAEELDDNSEFKVSAEKKKQVEQHRPKENNP